MIIIPTIQEIIDYVDRKYPNSETDANKVSDLNDIYKKVYVKIQMLKNEYDVDDTQTTIGGQLTYPLPSDCSIDNIITVKVSQDVDTTSDWDTYEFAGLKEDTTTGKYFGHGGTGLMALLSDDLPIQTTGLTVAIFYWKRPSDLSSSDMTITPDLDEDYHDLLKYGLIQSLAAQGQNPDTEIADYWQAKYDEYIRDVEASLSERYNKAPTQSNQVLEYW